MLSDFLFHASELRNRYWLIRGCRSVNRRRNLYRKAAKEKGQLVALGYSCEVVRLYALWLRDPSRENRYERFLSAFDHHLNGPKQLTLF